MTDFEITDYGNIVNNAFHGTLYVHWEKISGEGFRISENQSFLGAGVYFFDGSILHAKDWAKRWNPKRVRIVVIQAQIRLGRCFDLNNWQHRTVLKEVALVYQGDGTPVTEDKLINLLAKSTQVDTVKAIYTRPQKGTIVDEGRFYDYSQPMICVRNVNCILSHKLVVDEINDKKR